jgi:tRNA A37 threonylcarbamoyladenosine dehydratase
MENPFERTEWLIGEQALQGLKNRHVAIFGIGGVGACAAEMLARSGIGAFTLIDHDVVSASNINRQLHALHSTLEREKVAVMRARIKDINPDATVNAVPARFLPDGHDWNFSYIVDAVDTVSYKMQIITEAHNRGIPIISAMGAGNRLDPSAFKAGDLYETQGCPLAKIMRSLCRKNGIERLKVVYSTEPPKPPSCHERKSIASIAFVPNAAGLLLASVVVRDLLGA